MKKRSKVNEIWKTINTSELQIGETNDIDTMFMCVCFESKAVWATLIQGPGQNFYLKADKPENIGISKFCIEIT